MILGKLTSLPMLLVMGTGLVTFPARAQTSGLQPFVLLSGSELTEDCPLCDRLPIVVPLTGTFWLRLMQQTPLTSFYELTSISFRTAATSGLPYQVSGTGIYQVGGEVGLSQQLYLDTEIHNGFSAVRALCMSSNTAVIRSWPKLQIEAAQTNGTVTQVYSLALVAAPVPRFNSLSPDSATGDVRLEWDAFGAIVEVERASDVTGPFNALTDKTTNSFFIDAGVITNFPRQFYRLHLF